MTTFRGGQIVEPGFYLNLRQLHFESVDRARALTGSDDALYRRVPLIAMLGLAPILGLAFVVFLPFVAFASVLYMLTMKGADLAIRVAGAAARVVRPAWEPSLAFFSRSKPAKKTPAEPAADAKDEWAEDAEKKLQD
jgi:hypothetical protein